MKQHFETVTKKMLDGLSAGGYSLGEQELGEKLYTASLVSEKETVVVEYSFENKLFSLYRGETGSEADPVRVQTYLFDEQAGDGAKEAAGVANEFLETLQGQVGAGVSAPQPGKKKKKKDSDNDESTAEFFVNRIPSVMPECREPLLAHKSHYGQLLPRYFCEEVVTAAMRNMLKGGLRTSKAKDFFQLLSNMYAKGDLDTKAIIMQVLMPEITDERDVAEMLGMVGEELKKGYEAGKKYFGKDVKPEKVSAVIKAAKYQAETLKEMRG